MYCRKIRRIFRGNEKELYEIVCIDIRWLFFSEEDLTLSSNDDLRRDIGNHGSLVAGIIALLGPENVKIVNLKVRFKIIWGEIPLP